MIYSFDIFDTCLVRKCGAAVNMFDILARKAFRKQVSIEDYHSFVVERRRAEKQTYSSTQTLYDIYNAFSLDSINLRSIEELVFLELQCEHDMLVPVQSMLDRVNHFRERGGHIVFISDMYLSSDFLRRVLTDTGFYKEEDKIFVSCEEGATKAAGDIYQRIKDKLELHSFHHWHHYGDNYYSDVKVPQKLGIHSHHIQHKYTPYQQSMHWKMNVDFQWGSIMAGMSRALSLQSYSDVHYDFVLDIIAPLYTSFVYRILNDAFNHKINKLYFCARDAYPIYRIACQMQTLFPAIAIEYLYISRRALYEGDDIAKLEYYKQIGLASTEKGKAIVDIRTTGKTLITLNNLLQSNKYAPVMGYFFELCDMPDDVRNIPYEYHTELDDRYILQINSSLRRLSNNWYLYELFFPLNIQKRTIGYECINGIFHPVFEEIDDKEYKLENLQDYVEWRNHTLDTYTQWFIALGLYKFADKIFEEYAIPQLAAFFNIPNKYYLSAFEKFYGLRVDETYVPYVQKNLWRLPLNIFKQRTIWKRGTLVYSLPNWLNKKLFDRK